jgi:hypothetical protein
MFDRHWLGDLALAVLLSLPFVGLAQTQPYRQPPHAGAAATTAPAAAHSPDGRMGIVG